MSNFVEGSLDQEVQFLTSRSSGPGGQNVNKVNSKVTLKFNIRDSKVLSDTQKELLLEKLSNRITADGVLSITSQESRSQTANKEVAVTKFNQLMTEVFRKKKKRKATKPSKASREKRRVSKKQQAEKKQWRRKLL